MLGLWKKAAERGAAAGRDAPGGRCPAPDLLPRLATRPSGGRLPTARLWQGTSDGLPCRHRAPVPPSLPSPCPPPITGRAAGFTRSPFRGAPGRAGSPVSSPGKAPSGAAGAFAFLSLPCLLKRRADNPSSFAGQGGISREINSFFLRKKPLPAGVSACPAGLRSKAARRDPLPARPPLPPPPAPAQKRRYRPPAGARGNRCTAAGTGCRTLTALERGVIAQVASRPARRRREENASPTEDRPPARTLCVTLSLPLSRSHARALSHGAEQRRPVAAARTSRAPAVGGLVTALRSRLASAEGAALRFPYCP